MLEENSIWGPLLLQVVLILVNAIFAAAEIAAISMNDNKEAVDLSFGNLEEIIYKKIDAKNGNTLINDTTEIIDTKLQGDKIRRSFSEVNHWFDNYFIAFGSQTISNSEKERKRKIFFVNKLTINK